MANHGPSYGLSREMELKNAARFNLAEAIETLEWIQQCTRLPMETAPSEIRDEEDVADQLRDGLQLCRLMTSLGGVGYIDYHVNPRMPFYKMENISKFLVAAKNYGVAEHSCFQTVDLYECKQMYKVIECIRALAGVAQKRHAPVPIPKFAVKPSERNERVFDPQVLMKGQTLISLQYGTNKGASQSGMTPYGLSRQIMPDRNESASRHVTSL